MATKTKKSIESESKGNSNGSPNKPYSSEHKIRFVTAASLFDGHDASINIMRRILQGSGAEVIHLGHNRSVHEIVNCAIQEDVQGIAISSYQGGHVEYFKYMIELLRENGADHIKVFGGGGGVIVQDEIDDLHASGVTRIFSVEDGSKMGLQGMINFMLKECDFDPVLVGDFDSDKIKQREPKVLAKGISALENNRSELLSFDNGKLLNSNGKILSTDSKRDIPLLGITGTGGAGKSSLTDEIVRRFLTEFENLTIGIISVDPSRLKTGGALLGDRIRMNSIDTERVFMRSLATRASNRSTSAALEAVIELYKVAGFDLIIVETSGIGQSGTEIVDLTDIPMYVMTSEYGASTQLEKINMLDLADLVVLNKFEKKGSQDALRDIRKQMLRNAGQWHAKPEEMPVYPTIAAQFNDEGVNRLFKAIVDKINDKYSLSWETSIYTNSEPSEDIQAQAIIPGKRVRYLSEISETIRNYHQWVDQQVEIASKWDEIEGAIAQLKDTGNANGEVIKSLEPLQKRWEDELDRTPKAILEGWDELTERYQGESFDIKIRDKVIKNELYRESLSGLKIPRVAVPKVKHSGERLRFALKENLPGYFPYTAGVFPFKREGEDPTRMFAGEGTPERTNKRFHFVSEGLPAARLSTAFDSVTLYGEDPGFRPDIYGKIGNSGVSICSLDDMKKLYSGFELTAPTTSVSMTINGPAPMILAMFMNTVIDQEVERYLKAEGKWEEAQKKIEAYFKERGVPVPQYSNEIPKGNDGFGLGLLGITGDQLVDAEVYQKIKANALAVARGTVQADILKEDQAQNTCIFSTEFALKMMGDMQEYFTQHKVRNYYSVSISGYHIAEAGANPITQAAFTLANGFTYVEYYLARGLSIDDFAHNLSFFFSNGLDPEYAVIGRVARRIWAISMKNKYDANDRSQKLKYHIQTSGRSLHAQEIQFNDIRTTLQALLAIYDNCNSLHTNAYDEAITTPTEESVRRALAIQMIINKELGTAKNENINQGSFFVDELTDLVEEAILTEFDRITERGGVLGAMESMYQRGKIQGESLYYESQKHSGELPIIGVNTFFGKESEEENKPIELIRSTEEEKKQQITNLEAFWKRNESDREEAIDRLKTVARENGNLFEELMETVKVASLGQISHALYEVGGQYRRNM
ncbi:MAG: methylmalonyl-CoA mutase family protein [Balneolaceae bacterium]|nr:methylmalonyl-CoA mutase family protein [Balneolaceae bacterium]MBO6546428.1 methylmalonyl-CoA mutase family protein [Balneolaceae bacterium]MBO6648787.1 methylmalonyl-CoA mutase family protein [Balneolaceae bacterium]